MRVLIVEDYEPLRTSIGQGLREAGFAVDASADGEEGAWYARSNDYDVIVLDIMLPAIDGLTILSRLRQAGDKTPILLLTARDTVEDRVAGLNQGADDYLVKPFAFAELLARVRALVRRRYDAKDPVLHVHDLAIDTAKRTVHRTGEPIELTAREYALLEFLALRAGEVVSRTDIWEHLYEFDSSVESNVVNVYIGYLRKKLERPGCPPLIHTRRGLGYVLGP
jgi:DNA-binding response OmpR family regulator